MANFEGLMSPKACWKVMKSGSDGRLISTFVKLPGPPPKRPHGFRFMRSARTLSVIVSPSTSMTRRIPRPPRNLPGPALSSLSPYSSWIQGQRVSKISTGVLRQLACGTIWALLPSLVARPPQPIPSKW